VLRILPEPPVWKAVLGFDFDDTLVMKDSESQVDERFFDCLKWVRSTYGAAWGIATGRSLYELIEGLNEARFPFLPDFVIVREREIFFPGQFGRWVPDENWNKKCEKDHNRLFRKCRRMLAKIRNHVEKNTDARWVSVEGDAAGIVASTAEEMNEIQQVIEELSSHSDLTFERNTVYLRFSHRAYRKGSCLQEAADHWGLEADKILAIGDNFNDLSMLQPEVCEACGCPSNAIPEVRDYVKNRGGKVAVNPGSIGVIEVMKHYFDQ
jgi:HAD superfamily hydrolase (TIGR01484 family)